MRRIGMAAAALALVLTACSGGKGTSGPAEDISEDSVNKTNIELTLWTYPVGSLNSGSSLSSMIASFHREYPNINVSVKAISYETGDNEVEEVLKNGTAPDLIFEGPERLVANWGARGLMADVADLWEGDVSDQIYENVRVACHDAEGNYYIYPVCMSTHCMAINRDLFEAAGAWQYVDEETHTWSTDDFIAAVAALYESGVEEVAAVYCGGQGGDQGTRALVNNLYGGTFTDPQHTRYTVDSPENIRALELLKHTDGIVFDPELVGAEEIERFCDGDLAMAFCWNVSMEVRQLVNNTDLDFDIFPMAFPTDSGDPALQGGIWGFGIFDSGDEARIAAAKTFIRFITEEDGNYTRAVLASANWPVRDMPEIYANDKLMNEYGLFQQYLGDYYQVTPGWAEARTAWWNMLQHIGEGEDIAAAVKEFSDKVNASK